MKSLQLDLKCTKEDFALEVKLDVPTLGITAVFGPSGSGKSTLMRCIAGLEASSGVVALGQQVWQDSSNQLFVPTHERAIGFVFQEPRLFPHLDVKANLLFGVRHRQLELTDSQFQVTVAMLNLDHLLTRTPETLSGGEARRVAIGRALLTRPQILLMDEPMAGLDPSRRAELLPYLEAVHLSRSVPIVYVTHQIDEVMRLADHLVVLREGRVEAAGPFAQAANQCVEGLESISVVDCEVSGYHPDDRLVQLTFDGGTLLATGAEPKVGDAMRAIITARDVSLTLLKPEQTSILNILDGTIVALSNQANSVLVTVEVGPGSVIRSEISHRSARSLSLAPGTQVYAQVKALSLQYARGHLAGN